MSPAYPKRLIEVDLPIKRISAHARREKSIRHGHISTLHIWWARRPLAACRAVILAALWPDPADKDCPDSFRQTARERMLHRARDCAGKASSESFARLVRAQKDEGVLDDPVELRRSLLDFIADFANWDNSTDPDYLETSRALVQAAHESLGGAPGTRPLVVDPFAGGGAIPLEALRVGADAFASDLNPVAVLLNKVVLEYIPKYGQRLADEVRKWGQWIKDEAEKELAPLYPRDPDGATPIAYLWARTIKCEGPGCGMAFPLVGQTRLSCSARGSEELVLAVEGNRVVSRVAQHARVSHEPAAGTVRGTTALCPRCDYPMRAAAVQAQLQPRRGGSRDSMLLAVVCRSGDGRRKFARGPAPSDTHAAGRAADAEGAVRWCAPAEAFPVWDSRAFAPGLYGIATWNDLHTPRQFLALATFARLVTSIPCPGEIGVGREVRACLSLAVGRLVDTMAATCRWVAGTEKRGGSFIAAANGGEKHLRWITDFAEANPLSGETGSWDNQLGWVLRVLEGLALAGLASGQTSIASADALALPDDAADLYATDPPYGSAVPYADLSDFFYVWHRRVLAADFPEYFDAQLTPKTREAVVNLREPTDGRGTKDEASYHRAMTAALTKARAVTKPHGLAVVVFADKRTTEWEALLEAVLASGWSITGSWPLHTERPGRTRSINSASLSSSIHLICRPRENTDGSLRTDSVGDWREVLAALPKRIHEWMPRLADEGVVGADALFACLGPALEVFSQHSRVEKASGEGVQLKEYLEHVWAAVAREALSMIFAGAETSGFEEDARLTAMWLWTLSTAGNGKAEPAAEDDEDEADTAAGGNGKKAKVAGYVLEYDAARKIAQGLGAHLEDLTTTVEVKGETARLLPVAERTRHLFGRAEAEAPTAKRKKKDRQMKLGFAAELDEAEEAGGWGDKGVPPGGHTVLDRVHQSMILFAAGRGEALRRFLVEEGAGRDQRFWRLAQALAALYPAGSDERRWVEGVQARKKGLGL